MVEGDTILKEASLIKGNNSNSNDNLNDEEDLALPKEGGSLLDANNDNNFQVRKKHHHKKSHHKKKQLQAELAKMEREGLVDAEKNKNLKANDFNSASIPGGENFSGISNEANTLLNEDLNGIQQDMNGPQNHKKHRTSHNSQTNMDNEVNPNLGYKGQENSLNNIIKHKKNHNKNKKHPHNKPIDNSFGAKKRRHS